MKIIYMGKTFPIITNSSYSRKIELNLQFGNFDFFSFFENFPHTGWGQVNLNMVNPKFHSIQTFCQNLCNFPIFSVLNWTVNLNMVNLMFHLI